MDTTALVEVMGWAVDLSTVSVHFESVQDRDRQCGNMVRWAFDRLMDATALGEFIGWEINGPKVTVGLESLQ